LHKYKQALKIAQKKIKTLEKKNKFLKTCPTAIAKCQKKYFKTVAMLRFDEDKRKKNKRKLQDTTIELITYSDQIKAQ